MRAFFFLLLLPTILLAKAITQDQGKAFLDELKAIKKSFARSSKMVLLKKPSQKEDQQQLKMWQPLSNPIRGNLKAPVTLIEFTDYKCPFCKKF